MITPPVTDAAARERLLGELDTTFFVEAGAGTGKTTALVGRIVELIATGRLVMERLAAITFTEAAAAELRDRVRQELERAATERTDPRQRAACELASRQVDIASIQTLHAFAGSLLRTFPLEAHLPPNFTMLDEIQQERAFDDRFRAWLYDQVPDPSVPERRAAVRRVLALGMSADQMRSLARQLEDYRDLLNPQTTWNAPALRDPIATARDWGRQLVDLGPAIEEALNPADRLVGELHRLQPIAERMAAVDDFDEALRLLRQCDPKKQAGSAANWPHGRCAAIKRILKNCADDVESVTSDHRAAGLAALLGWLREFTLTGADERRRIGEATFHDLLAWARDLLRDHPEVRRRAQARYDRLLVDEFQDTDPLQVEIAWFMASDPAQSEERNWTALRLVPGKLFIVGDPKQSIYRFRRADIGIYQQVYAHLENVSDRVVLSQSFRSPAQVLDWVNHHFTADMQFIDRAQPAYSPLDPRPREPLDAATASFGVRRMGERVEPASARWLAEADAVARAARRIVRGPQPWRVTDRHGSTQSRPARFNDVCVLIPSRSNLRRLERSFQQYGVPYRMESGWLVLHTQEVRDLLSCLRAIDDPSDQVALVAALRSPAYGCSDVDLLRWIDGGGRFDYERPRTDGNGPVAEALASMRSLHEDRLNHTPAELIELFIRARMLAVQAFGTPQPRDALRRLRYVVTQARSLASSGATTLRELCDWLETRQSELYYDAESAVPDSDEDAVRLLTVHGAKGLEFPIVILTGLSVATSRVGPRSVDLVPRYDTGVLDIRCGEFATMGYSRATESAMYEAEQKRLLYVATTRARDHLVLSLYHGKDESHAVRIVQHLSTRPELVGELDNLDAASLAMDGASSAALADLFDTASDELAADQHRAEEAAFEDQRQRLIARLGSRNVVAPSSLSHVAEVNPADPPPEPDPENTVRRLRRGRGGSALGRAVHAVLQVIDLESLADLDELAQAAARDEHIPDAARTIGSFVRHAAASRPVQDALASGRYWREVPVGIVREDGATLEGAIDLLHERSDGSLVIVDYKSDSIGEDELSTRAESYFPQGEAYAACVTRATGRPVDRVSFVFAALGGRVGELAIPRG